MVAIPRLYVPIPASPLDSPRDWSHKWDGQEPPHKGEPCYVVMLVGVKKKSGWQPRTTNSMPPIVYQLGACLMTWTRDVEAARRDCHTFNRNQVAKLAKGGKVTLWAVVGWGCCQFPSTVRALAEGGAQ